MAFDQFLLNLIGVQESLKTFDGFATSPSSRVGAVELEVQGQSDEDDQAAGQHAGKDTWVVPRRVLGAENGASDNTANAAKADQGRRAEGSLPLASDVVGLPCEDCRYIRVTGRDGNEDAEIANGNIFEVAQKR